MSEFRPTEEHWERALHRRMPWVQVQVDPRGRTLRFEVVDRIGRGEYAWVQFVDRTGDQVHARGRIPVATVPHGEAWLALIDELLSMFGAVTDHAALRRQREDTDRIRDWESEGGAARAEELDAEDDSGPRPGGAPSLVAPSATGAGSRCGSAPARRVERPDHHLRAVLGAVSGDDAGRQPDHGPADREPVRSDEGPDAAGGRLDPGGLTWADPADPYAVAAHARVSWGEGRTVLEYRAGSDGRVYRRSSRNGGATWSESRWDEGTAHKALASIRAVVGTRTIAGWTCDVAPR